MEPPELQMKPSASLSGAKDIEIYDEIDQRTIVRGLQRSIAEGTVNTHLYRAVMTFKFQVRITVVDSSMSKLFGSSRTTESDCRLGSEWMREASRNRGELQEDGMTTKTVRLFHSLTKQLRATIISVQSGCGRPPET
ncbi:hypothetical protein GE061_017057 [Apolygus lucorum]|uniref:Uncharacterized protein n=1 Tax=Apolygus lucorum TaxID=248454 RepID=A0A8S9XJ17_APOLU|nr:hypothetical protein GE061_017057 [Apolygus lucorum]